MADDILPRFAAIPSGRFTMGTPDGNGDEQPEHNVRVDGFHASCHPITVEQYAAFVRDTGHPAPSLRELPLVVTTQHELTFRELAAPYVWRGGEPPRERATHPVTLITYSDAMAYCRWLSGQIGQLVRLPTEAEWERAARGGLERRRYPWGDDIDASRGNFLHEPALKKHRGTRPVGSYPANDFGLFDMAGNVWQWVADWYGADAYRDPERHNPRGPAQGVFRVLRGGSWVTHDVDQLRCAHRHKVPPDTYAYSIGFRVVYSG
ncbi:MAG: formylglycine-generating enzyme family protein [Acidobacteria bacterium]|nr:formylglycine-generating enzyme family protein [Acidobacteriota bacterium]